MSNLINVILASLIAVQFQGMECNPVHAEKEISEVQQNARVFKPDTKEWTHFHHSWGLPHFPSLTSVSSFFQDEDDNDRIATKQRLEELEKNQKEILSLLQKLSEGIPAKKDQSTPKPVDKEPQTPSTLDDKRPTSQPSIEKETATKRIEMETVSSTVPSTAPSTVSSTVPSTVASTTTSTTVTRPPVTETSTAQETAQQPQISSSSEEPQPQKPEQNENTNPNSNFNIGDNQESADTAVGQENSPTDTNSGSIVAFDSDESRKAAGATESSA
ncbi:hypothetical protein KPH14_009756 [Odynerus spinipes]|uniref:Uncharacterized protein n=1 Tax=Odynerus spinipes TaxID=1348599 RepID=A0AAD9RFP0_9HYME|nr:hypothetical protein KPH14_009756 [Odynerus spinipes]